MRGSPTGIDRPVPVRLTVLLLIGCLVAASSAMGEDAERPPNILWITVEDLSPHLGCYGDAQAYTPCLDELASQGVRYTSAFAHAGVCAPARCGLITGMYPTSLGAHHMRSLIPLPEDGTFFTAILREHGYYCSNRSKEDYNLVKPGGVWDESGGKAHWRKREPGQPFFSVFNLAVTHESRIRTSDSKFASLTSKNPPESRHDPEQVMVPPYYPDTPAVRNDLARLYDLTTAMDGQVGKILDQLKKDGLEDDTIVFFFSDHGDGLPRAKRWLYDSGIRVPLLVRVPDRFSSISPGETGLVSDRLVSFVDFAPTVLSLAGISPPDSMQGVPFLGPHEAAPRQYVYAARDRMDERYDMTRAVRDSRFKYIRNYRSELPYAQTLDYMEYMPTMKDLRHHAAKGALPDAARLFMGSRKPPEELYDCTEDPHEVQNLAGNPEYATELKRLRAQHQSWVVRTQDLGFVPEAEMLRRCDGRSPRDWAATDLPWNRIHAAAALEPSTAPSPEEVVGWLGDEEEVVRFWGLVSVASMSREEIPFDELKALLGDASPSVRLQAAALLCREGRFEEGIPVLKEGLADPDPWVRLPSVIAIDHLGEEVRSLKSELESAVSDENKYVVRVASTVLERLNRVDGGGQ